MPKWTPVREWEGQSVFIIGGGTSLREFQWSRLRGLKTIGCNSAFRLGASICSICFCSDVDWFNTFEDELSHYSGRVVSHAEHLSNNHPWLLKLPRNDRGLTTDGSIFFGEGGSSGSGAIHLALLLGAARVFLLGFDGQLGPAGDSNWHKHIIEKPNPNVYDKFIEGFDLIARTYQIVFPGTEIYNCNLQSRYKMFPFLDVDTVLHHAAA